MFVNYGRFLEPIINTEFSYLKPVFKIPKNGYLDIGFFYLGEKNA